MGLKIAFFGSSLVSSYWNGAATYYRGIIKELHLRGHRVTFFEPNAYQRQQNRDLDDPYWAKVVVYDVADDSDVQRCLDRARSFDLVIKASGVGVFDALLERGVLELKNSSTRVIFWDVDAPATLDRMLADPADSLRKCIPDYDCILTYGGGDAVIDAYVELGARGCFPIYNALDPREHVRCAPDTRFAGLLGFMGSRMPDREERVQEFLFGAAQRLPDQRFVLGGTGWSRAELPPNIIWAGHVYTRDHNAFNSTPRAILNVNRASMARYGFSPPTRIFEAAGSAACIISDRWDGIEHFLEPGEEVLVADSGMEVAELLAELTPERARAIGAAARRRVLDDHTYEQRVAQLETILEGAAANEAMSAERHMAS